MGSDIEARLEPVQRCIGSVNVLREQGFGVPAAVNGLGPENVCRREVVRIEGDDEVGTVERCIKLNHIQAGGVDGLITEGDVHFGIGIDGVVEFELQHPLVCEVTKIEGERCKHAVYHQASIQVVADECTVGHHQLSAFLHGDGGPGFDRDVGVDGERGTVTDHDVAVHVPIFRPRLRGRYGRAVSIAGWHGHSQW